MEKPDLNSQFAHLAASLCIVFIYCEGEINFFLKLFTYFVISGSFRKYYKPLDQSQDAF